MNSLRRVVRQGALAALALVAIEQGCAPGGGEGAPGGGGGEGPTPNGEPEGPLPFEAVSPYAYTAKVKNLLTGLPPSDDEAAAVAADPAALRGLVDDWMARPEFGAKMLTFFGNAFQQSNLTTASLLDQLGNNGRNTAALAFAMQESFPRTALALVNEGRPFTEAVTTRSFQMTPALMSFYAFVDEADIDDLGEPSPLPLKFTASWAGPAVSLAETLDPASPNFMRWTIPGPGPQGCANPITERAFSVGQPLFPLLFGLLQGAGQGCQAYNFAPFFGPEDYSAWRAVTVRPPAQGEATTRFYDLPTLRAANELVLRLPRVGFFTTPAFFANWATNDSNQMRVTTNQTLIVALGASFDGKDSTVPLSQAGLAAEHAAPGTECYGCHQALDPMRRFFQQAYSHPYHAQRDPAFSGVTGEFAFGGDAQTGQGPDDLAAMLAAHPAFAEAWAQKLCYYADSAPCSAGDPEFGRVVDAFRASGHDFKTLVRELFSSPLVTGAAPAETFDDRGVVVSIARADHFCDALSLRLGLQDFCGLRGPDLGRRNGGGKGSVALTLASAMPADAFSRGSEVPVTLSDVTLFYAGTAEGICRLAADQIVGANKRYVTNRVDDALADLTRTVMGLASSDPRSAPAAGVLREHHDAALARGAAPADALKSTFVLACTSPPSAAVGL